jgi:aerobic carbon-monoxide dehydrogenase large subunit
VSLIGQGVRRLEDRPLLTGAGRFAADISFPHQLFLRVVRSPVAFGRLRGVDTREAMRAPGVVAVWTRDDVAAVPAIDFRMTRVEGLEPYRQPVLAREFVRYVGEPVACVFAEDAYLAEDVAELVAPEIEDLIPIISATAPPGEFGPGISSEAAVIRKRYGDLDQAFRQAHEVVELELAVGRHTGVPLETRGAIARYDAGRDRLELYGAAKVPHYNRDAIATMLGLPPGALHLFEGHIGGGFGVRGELYPEDVLVCLAALRLKRPVKWIEDRNEHLIAANHSRDQMHRVRAAIDSRGFILGLEDEFWADQGAYVRTHAATVADLTAAILPGPYVIPAYRATGHIRLTNKTPAGTYRAPGRYESTFVRERLIDAIAHRLGLDPIEVRRTNLIPPEKMPFARPIDALGTKVTYDSGDCPGLLQRTLDHLRYDELKAALAKRRRAGELVGVGFAFFVEKSGLGPFDGVRIAVDAGGRVEVVTGVASVGQGIETVIAQICADALGAPLDAIRVLHGRTDQIAYGMGAFASRVTVMAGSATHLAATKLRHRALEVGAALLQVHPDDLEIEQGRIAMRGTRDGTTTTLADVARTLAPASPYAADREPGLQAEAWFHADHMTYPYGLHVAVARVDPDTGGVHIERCVVAYDIGRAVNPVLVEGQITGGVAQGVGGALLEEFVYDEHGQPLAASFVDYLLPTSAEMPPVEALVLEEAPSPLNPLGVKGAGEAGINGMGAAIAAAVDDAIGRPGAITRLPITPCRLYALLSAGAM